MPLLLSGGAIGADSLWDSWARAKKHDVIHWSFQTHKSRLSDIYVLTDEELKEADACVDRANKTLNRTYPTNSEHVNNLLRRNYFQIAQTERVYAVSNFDSKPSGINVEGGTAWALTMYLDRFIHNESPWSDCEMYLWEQKLSKWFSWETDRWNQIERPPTPHGTYTGIGSRKLTTSAVTAINIL